MRIPDKDSPEEFAHLKPWKDGLIRRSTRSSTLDPISVVSPSFWQCGEFSNPKGGECERMDVWVGDKNCHRSPHSLLTRRPSELSTNPPHADPWKETTEKNFWRTAPSLYTVPPRLTLPKPLLVFIKTALNLVSRLISSLSKQGNKN